MVQTRNAQTLLYKVNKKGKNSMNKLINILGKAEWEDEVLDFFEEFKIPKSPKYKEGDRYYARYTPSNFIWFIFENDCITEDQKRRKAEENYYLQHITFHFDNRKNDENINLPFEFKHGNTYKDVIQRLGEPHYEDKKFELSDSILRKTWILKKDSGELYRVFIKFNNKSKDLELEHMGIWTADPEKPLELEYFQLHTYNPLEDKERNYGN